MVEKTKAKAKGTVLTCSPPFLPTSAPGARFDLATYGLRLNEMTNCEEFLRTVFAFHVKNLRSLRHLFPQSDKSTTLQTTRATLFFTLEPKRKWRVRNFLKK